MRRNEFVRGKERFGRHGTPGRPMELLLVEDSVASARLVRGALEHGGFDHRLTWVNDGAAAIDFLFRRGRFKRAPRPDLVLLDLTLPGVDGREVLRQLKEDARTRDLPVVVLTASMAREDRVEAERAGVEAYLTKPFDFEKFVNLVRNLRDDWHEERVLPDGAAFVSYRDPDPGEFATGD